MSGKDETAGTPGQDDGDALNGTTGTPASDDRNARSESGISREEALAWKAKAERLNALERRHGTDFEARLEQPPAAQDDEPEDAGGDDDDWKGTLSYAERKDPVARTVVKMAQFVKRREALRDQLEEIDDKALRDETRAHFIKNQHRLGDVRAARAEIERDRLMRENEELRKKADRSREPEVNREAKTTLKEGPNGAPKPATMTEAEFEQQRISLPMMQSLKLQRDYAEGRIIFKD